MDKTPNMSKLPALIEDKRLIEAEYLALGNMSLDKAFKIVDRLGEIQERIDFHSQTGMYAAKTPVTYCVHK